MRARSTLLLLVLSVFLLSSQPALAVGLGVYFSAQDGSANDWEIDEGGFLQDDIEDDGDLEAFGVGFVLDTNPARDGFFNYRLNIGLERLDVDFDRIGDTTELDGLIIDNTFGFQIFHADVARLWIGPRIRTGFYWGEFDDLDHADLAIFQGGAGVSFGANFNMGDSFTLGVTTGYFYSGFVGIVDDSGFDDNDITGTGGTFFLNIALMGRTGN